MDSLTSSDEAMNSAMLDEIASHLGLSRRELIARGGFGLAGVAATSLIGCKATGAKSALETTAPVPNTSKFLDEIALAEKATPLPAPTDPTFGDAALRRNIAVSGTIGRWLASRPYDMLQELLDQPASFTIFKRDIGPAIVFRHPHVIECLERTKDFTVKRYYPEMKAGTDGEYDTSKMKHYILGTDDETLYRPDGMLLRHVVKPGDKESILRPLIAKACANAVASRRNPLDVVPTLCRQVPVAIVSQYLGVPTYEESEDSFIAGVKGGGKFAITPEMSTSFKYSMTEGDVPNVQRMYEWVRGAFRNIFNNLSPIDPKYTQFRAEGRRATEFLSAYIHKVILHYKPKIKSGDADVPDTMLTRLLRLQLEVAKGGGTELAKTMNITRTELARRLEDGRIRANLFGTVVGGVVNPEEGSARMIDSILRLKEGKYKINNGSTYDQLANAAKSNGTAENELIRRYALEALRLQPQGEVVVRDVEPASAAIGGINLPKGTLVFVAHSAAMRDKSVAALADPLAFDVTRDEMLTAFEGKPGEDRPKEEPQSQIYLQHGYGRHKCLGRYASELTLAETLRAVVNLGDVQRAGPLLMDDDGLYATRLLIKA